MNARPRSPAKSERPGQVVRPRQYKALQCSEDEQLLAALDVGHLSTRQMFAFASHASAVRPQAQLPDSLSKKVERHLPTCKHCLRDFAGIAEILIEHRSGEADEHSPPDQLSAKFDGPPLELLAIACLESETSTSPEHDEPCPSRLSMTYDRDRDLKVVLRERREICRLDIYHARFPPGTMLRVQCEQSGKQRAVHSYYVVMKKQPSRKGVTGDAFIRTSTAEGRSRQEITIEIMASARVLQETDAKSLRESFELAISQENSRSPQRAATLAAWSIWATRALEVRALSDTIQALAEEICRQYVISVQQPCGDPTCDNGIVGPLERGGLSPA